MRALRPTPRLLVVTDHLPGTLHDPTDLACDAHLVSPVPAEQLLSTIAELIDVPRRRRERVPLDVLVHTEGFAFDQAVDATLSTGVNLSEDGMLLEANRQLGIGARGSSFGGGERDVAGRGDLLPAQVAEHAQHEGQAIVGGDAIQERVRGSQRLAVFGRRRRRRDLG